MSETEPLLGRKSSTIGGVARVVAVHNTPAQHVRWLPMQTDPSGATAASYRVLRYRLRNQGDPRTIAVTSPKVHEGKTTTAINLAMALAEDGRESVLLLEANFERPRIAELLGFTPPSCFAAQLEHSLDHPSASWDVVAAYFDNLHVLAVDPAQKQSRMMWAPAFKAAMRRLATQAYAYIVVDCPSVLGSAEVNMIVDTVDALLFTAISGRSHAGDLRRAEEHLAPANIIGTILLGAE
ncbi:MAG TPA: CpsD/CapB family tyrosine-protein kinase [Polyangiaceae bacterium]|nr:CpsD/CapB family tyrosine-protein kinase [Polyangiaceae bacterium]